MIPHYSSAVEVYVLFRAKKGKGPGLQREERIHRKMEKSKYVLNKCLLGPTETMGHGEEL